jgi:hypothetical protein
MDNETLGLRVGDWVEVRSAAEIFATLDERGCLDALPFMPEMLSYCGKSSRYSNPPIKPATRSKIKLPAA